MAEKKSAKKEKKESNQADLKEILGDIKTVVSGEKETLFKVNKYKTISLKKENLIKPGKKNHSSASAILNSKELKEMVKKIVRNELNNLQLPKKSPKLKSVRAKTVNKMKSSSRMDLSTKTELLSLAKKNKLGLSSKNTKAEIIKELKENNIEAP